MSSRAWVGREEQKNGRREDKENEHAPIELWWCFAEGGEVEEGRRGGGGGTRRRRRRRRKRKRRRQRGRERGTEKEEEEEGGGAGAGAGAGAEAGGAEGAGDGGTREDNEYEGSMIMEASGGPLEALLGPKRAPKGAQKGSI